MGSRPSTSHRTSTAASPALVLAAQTRTTHTAASLSASLITSLPRARRMARDRSLPPMSTGPEVSDDAVAMAAGRRRSAPAAARRRTREQTRWSCDADRSACMARRTCTSTCRAAVVDLAYIGLGSTRQVARHPVVLASGCSPRCVEWERRVVSYPVARSELRHLV